MNWQQITQKLNPYLKKMDPYIEKARIYGEKVAEFTEEQIQSTPLFIKTQAEYDDLLIHKRFILIAYDEAHADAPRIRKLSPLWMTRAFMDNAILRYISLTEAQELAKTLLLGTGIDMRIRFNGKETRSYHTLNDIEAWWKNTCYTISGEPEFFHSDTANSEDPLAHI